MKRLFIAAAAALSLLLGGCATTVRSDVTTFHQWPAQIADKSYAFELPAPQDDTLELRSYQELVRAELARLGFHDSGAARPALLVSMRFMTTDVPVRVVQPALSPFYPSAQFGFSGRRRFWGGWYDPFPAYEVSVEHAYQRQLQVAIRSVDGQRLFDVTVHNVSRELSTPKMMPALVRSAFADFPGPNGVARHVELRQDKG
jgi:hypothetical protein